MHINIHMQGANEIRILIEVGERVEIGEDTPNLTLFVPAISEVVSFKKAGDEALSLADVERVIWQMMAQASGRCDRLLMRWRAYEDLPLAGKGEG